MRKGPLVVDASGHIAGRLSSKVAKLVLEGERVVVVNAEKILLSGNRRSILEDWMKKLEISSVVHPRHGPFHPRTPDRIMKRMVRGMLPRRQPKGMNALKRLRVHVGVPEQYSKVGAMSFQDAKATKPLSFYMTFKDLAKMLGWKGE